jgi:hypothetical protein
MKLPGEFSYVISARRGAAHCVFRRQAYLGTPPAKLRLAISSAEAFEAGRACGPEAFSLFGSRKLRGHVVFG